VVCGGLAEVKKVIQRSGLLFEKASADAAPIPVVFDETKNGRLIREAVVDVIVFGMRGNNDQRKPRAVTPASRSAPCGCNAASAGAREIVVPHVGLILQTGRAKYLFIAQSSNRNNNLLKMMPESFVR
jgi:hypothetical protein